MVVRGIQAVQMKVSDKSISVVTKSKAVNPLGIVSLIPNVQIYLGMYIQELLTHLKVIRKPLGLFKIAESNGLATWRFMRFQTGKIPEETVCTLNTYNNRIIYITFNPRLVLNTDYVRYEGLSIIHQITAGKVGDSNILSKAIKAVSVITGESPADFLMKSNKNTIVVYTNKKNLSNQYRYTFAIDPRGYYNLLSVGFLNKGGIDR